MAILRNPNKEKFTVIGNFALRDGNLSLKARGLLVTMISLPDNWHFSEAGLCAILPKDGQSSIRSGLKELEQYGYLTRTRTRDGSGKVSDVVWTICDNPRLENPSVVNPNVDIPNLENQLQLNTNTSNTKKLNTNVLNTENIGRKRRTHELKHKRGEYGWVLLSDTEYQRLIAEYGEIEVARAIRYVDESAQGTGNRNGWKDWNLTVRKCIRDGWGKNNQKNGGNNGKIDVHGGYEESQLNITHL